MRVAWTYVAIIIGASIGLSLLFIALMGVGAIVIAIPMGALNALLVLESARLPLRTGPPLQEKDIRELAIKARLEGHWTSETDRAAAFEVNSWFMAEVRWNDLLSRGRPSCKVELTPAALGCMMLLILLPFSPSS